MATMPAPLRGAISTCRTPVALPSVFLEKAGSGGSGEAARISGEIMKAIIAEKGIK